eukprot:Pgem_evm1s12486
MSTVSAVELQLNSLCKSNYDRRLLSFHSHPDNLHQTSKKLNHCDASNAWSTQSRTASCIESQLHFSS